jgi:hypothetical protein
VPRPTSKWDLLAAIAFTANRFAWTRKNTLGTYFVSATSSHYLWARTRTARCRRRDADSKHGERTGASPAVHPSRG